MSFQNISNILLRDISNTRIATMVANGLRIEHQNESAITKRISRITGANMHSVNKWCQGVNAPTSKHLLMLIGIYPHILREVLYMIGRHDIWELCEAHEIPEKMHIQTRHCKTISSFSRDKYVSISVSLPCNMIAKLNQRQLWFTGELQRGKKLKTSDIVTLWNISTKTAQRDILGLRDIGLIRYKGATKNGFYEIV